MVSAIPDMAWHKRIKAKFENYSVLPGGNNRIFFFVLIAFLAGVYPGLGRSAEQGVISLEVRDETLEKTLGRVSRISGYTIYLQPEWRDLSVTVSLLNLTLEQAVLKILDNRINHAIVWNDQEKKISITGVEISQIKQGVPGGIQQPKNISGQEVRFEQESKTAFY